MHALPRPCSLLPLLIIPTVHRQYEPCKWVSVNVHVSCAHIHMRVNEHMQTYTCSRMKSKVGGRGHANAGEAVSNWVVTASVICPLDTRGATGLLYCRYSSWCNFNNDRACF